MPEVPVFTIGDHDSGLLFVQAGSLVVCMYHIDRLQELLCLYSPVIVEKAQTASDDAKEAGCNLLE